jgi:hypothetical protein
MLVLAGTLCRAAIDILRAQGTPAAPAVQLAGVMGGTKALLVIDGQTQMLAVGERARGIRLLSLQGDTAEVERDGSA